MPLLLHLILSLCTPLLLCIILSLWIALLLCVTLLCDSAFKFAHLPTIPRSCAHTNKCGAHATRSDEFQGTTALVPLPPSPLRLTASHAAPRERVHRQGREGVHLEGGEDIRPVPLRMVCPLPTATRHATSRIARQPFITRHSSLVSCSCSCSCLLPPAGRTVCAVSVVPRAPLHAATHSPVAHLAVPHITVLTAPSCSARTRSRSASDFAASSGRTTVNAQDVLDAIKEVGFEEFAPRVQQAIECMWQRWQCYCYWHRCW